MRRKQPKTSSSTSATHLEPIGSQTGRFPPNNRSLHPDAKRVRRLTNTSKHSHVLVKVRSGQRGGAAVYLLSSFGAAGRAEGLTNVPVPEETRKAPFYQVEQLSTETVFGRC